MCHTRDLESLVILGALVKDISELVHALQKERGASSIFLGSSGAQFLEPLTARVTESTALERLVRERFEHIDEKLDRMSSGARFYTRVALALRALDTLPATRRHVAALSLAPQDAIKSFTEIIGCLLAVGFEVADIAADPEISRALIALVNFVQGKEFAGQERATAGAVFSRGRVLAAEQRRLRHLASAQEQAFRLFTQFADPSHLTAFRELHAGRESQEVERMRALALRGGTEGTLTDVAAATWYQYATRRIDAMKTLEDRLAADLGHRCAQKLDEAQAKSADAINDSTDAIGSGSPIAMLVAHVDPALNNLGLDAGVGLYALEGALPKPMHSILDVVQAQSRRLDDVSHQLASAHTALAERKVIERAKGLVMKSRGLAEKEAYALMREAAMNHNKRIVEIAEAIVSAAGIL